VTCFEWSPTICQVAPSVVSVTELNRLARTLLEREIPLLWVAGEISNLTRAASGHIYFSLKDENAQVRCVMFRSRAQLVSWQLANGQQVEARALVSLYEARGDFQLSIEALRRAGLGRLYEAFARLRLKLESEGLFAPERKRSLPRYPRTIAIVSSSQAAALKDVIAAFRRRAPQIQLILYPTPVQGDGAAERIAMAIAEAASDGRGELLLLVRGGGSIEDLWAFNEEVVARALAASRLPSIAGIGHESDTTIADWVADVRAATPTAAAEIATQGWVVAATALKELDVGLQRGTARRLERLQQRLDDYALRLTHPATRLAQQRDHLALLDNRLTNAIQHRQHDAKHLLLFLQARLMRAAPRLEHSRHRVDLLGHRLRQAGESGLSQLNQRLRQAAAALDHLNPEATVARGYAIVRDKCGTIVSRADQLAIGSTVSLQLAIGRAEARIENTEIAPIPISDIASE
jgi:exodeoxyribonuclease VII large subunit